MVNLKKPSVDVARIERNLELREYSTILFSQNLSAHANKPPVFLLHGLHEPGCRKGNAVIGHAPKEEQVALLWIAYPRVVQLTSR